MLTPRGMIEMEDAYKDVNQREYRLDVTEVENGHVAKVSKTNPNAKQFVVFIPKEETLPLKTPKRISFQFIYSVDKI